MTCAGEQLHLFDPPAPLRPGDPHCLDCGVHTVWAGEYYSLRNEVWPLHPFAGMLCVGCLEERLGRRLRPDDFVDCQVNGDDGLRSDRLKARLRGSR